MRTAYFVLFAWGVALTPQQSWAHPGGLNGEGCHTNRKTGEYHCHRGSGANSRDRSRSRANRLSGASGVYYANCAAARAAYPSGEDRLG